MKTPPNPVGPPVAQFDSWVSFLNPTPSMYVRFTYLYHTHQPNVGKYTSLMDGMGIVRCLTNLHLKTTPWRRFCDSLRNLKKWAECHAAGDCRQPPGAQLPTGMQAGAMARGSTYQVEPMIAQVMRCVFEKSRVLLLVPPRKLTWNLKWWFLIGISSSRGAFSGPW